MFNITKLSRGSQSFISELMTNGTNTQLIGSIAIAKVISDGLDLPPGPVESVTDFFRTTNAVDFNQVLSNINELVMVDYDTVNEYVLRFYTFRYYSVFPNPVTIALNNATAIEDFFGVSRAFTPVSLDVIRTNAIRLTGLVGRFKTLLEELRLG